MDRRSKGSALRRAVATLVVAVGAVAPVPLRAAPAPHRADASAPAPRRADAGAPAAPESAEVSRAREQYAVGLKLFGEKNYKGALAEIESANALAPNYRLLYDIALCHRELGDYLTADEVLQKHLKDGGDALTAKQREEVEKTLEGVQALIAHIAVRVNVPDADLLIDDKIIGRVPATPIAVNPGQRKVWASKAGYRLSSKEVVAESSTTVDVVLNLTPLEPAQKPVAPSKSIASPVTVGAALAGIFAVIVASVLVLRRRRRDPAQGDTEQSGTEFALPVGGEVPEVEPTPQHAVAIAYDPDPPANAAKPAAPLVLDGAVAHDIGKVKPNNQDSFLLMRKHGLFAIADGIGGNAGGGVASAIAVRAIRKWFDGGSQAVGQLNHLPQAAGVLATAVYAANRAIRQGQAADWNISEMGTTCVAARFCTADHLLYLAHVGDSRAYRLRAGKLDQMTTDHTMAELGMVGPRANHLSRALGSDACPKIDVLTARPLAGDVYLLCSDGLTKMISVEQLAGLLGTADSASKMVASLVELANAQGGQDNITVVVVRVAR